MCRSELYLSIPAKYHRSIKRNPQWENLWDIGRTWDSLVAYSNTEKMRLLESKHGKVSRMIIEYLNETKDERAWNYLEGLCE